MSAVIASYLSALRQLADPAILRVLFKSLAVSIVLFVLLGWGVSSGIDWLLARTGWGDGAFLGAAEARGAASLLLTILGLWLLWRVIAMAVIGFFAEDVARAVEQRDYPDAVALAQDLPASRQLAIALRSAGRALVVNLAVLPIALLLLVTGVGTAIVFWFANAILLGRDLQDMVWLRQEAGGRGAAPIGAGQRFALGGVTAALLLIPFANLLAPLLGAAGATHLLHRRSVT